MSHPHWSGNCTSDAVLSGRCFRADSPASWSGPWCSGRWPIVSVANPSCDFHVIVRRFLAADRNRHTLESVLMFRLLTGFGLGGAMPNAIAMTSEYTSRRVRATAITMMFCGFRWAPRRADLSPPV